MDGKTSRKIRIGFVGSGYRARVALKRYSYLEDVEIKALCDVSSEQAEAGRRILTGRGIDGFDVYCGHNDSWLQVIERSDIDLIYISTPWEAHARMAVSSMERGKHVAVEVPLATTVDECGAIVDASRRTGRHCVMLENCCYDLFSLNILNIVQQGLLGEISHAEGAYIHRLCERMLINGDGGIKDWMSGHYQAHAGNSYPTHGLGPLAQALDINRGDRFDYIVSMSSDVRGENPCMETVNGGSAQSARKLTAGIMNTSLIRTVGGKTIVLQHDISSPRPYSRIGMLSGTLGMAVKYPQEGIAMMPDYEELITGERLEELLSRYRHPVVAQGEKLFSAVDDPELQRRGPMDFIMDYRLIYCLSRGLPPDMDVYDAASWSCITELSEQSVHEGGIPVKIPDFTYGEWESRPRLKFHY